MSRRLESGNEEKISPYPKNRYGEYEKINNQGFEQAMDLAAMQLLEVGKRGD